MGRRQARPFEHRGKLYRTFTAADPPAVSELIAALTTERDIALRKYIVLSLLAATRSADIRDLRQRLSAVAGPIPEEEELRELLRWRLPR